MTPQEKQAKCDAEYASMCVGLETKPRNNLEKLKRTLDGMVTSGSHDFRVATVVRAMNERLGKEALRESSIRNKEGVHFKRLIAVFAGLYGAEPDRSEPGSDQRLLSSIQDQALRSQVRRKLNDIRYLTTENATLKSHLSRLRAIDPEALLAYARGVEPPKPTGTAFTPLEKAAVRAFLENVTDLLEGEWDRSGSGALLTTRGDEVAPAAFHQALTKVLGDGALTGQLEEPEVRLLPAAAD